MDSIYDISLSLLPVLSQGATISTDCPPRWSTYEAPRPIAVVNVNSEADVAVTVSRQPLPLTPPNIGYNRFVSVTNMAYHS
jgi:hypothetical protein